MTYCVHDELPGDCRICSETGDMMPGDTPAAPTTPDDLWDELIMHALASDGPIRDSDVKEAVRYYRPKIEAAIAAQAVQIGFREGASQVAHDRDDKVARSTPAEALREALEHVLDVWAAPSPEEFARLHRVLTGHDSCSSRLSDERVPDEAEAAQGAAPRAEGLDVEKIVRATLLFIDQTTPLSVGEPLIQKVLARLSRPSDERVPESEER